MKFFSSKSPNIFSSVSHDQQVIASPSRVPWKDYALSEKTRSIRLGTCRLWFREHEDDLWLAHWHGKNFSDRPPSEPEESAWERWGLNNSYRGLSLRPAVSPVPHLVIPEHPLIVAPKVKIRLYVQTPLWIQVYLRSKRLTTLVREFPTLQLSKTWFGDTMQGELCHALSTRAARHIDSHEKLPNYAISPITIRNSSRDDLQIEKICLRGQSFTLYQGEYRIWTSETRITYRGKKHNSRIEISEETPPEVENNIPIGLPRSNVSAENFVARTFSQIKHFSQLEI